MSKTQYIVPETAAHNIASALSNKFITNHEHINFSSLDDTKVCALANEATIIYATAYDEAYAKILEFNDSLVRNPE